MILQQSRAACVDVGGCCGLAGWSHCSLAARCLLHTLEAPIAPMPARPPAWLQGVPLLPELRTLRLSGVAGLADWAVAEAGSDAASSLLQLARLEQATLAGCRGLDAVPASFRALAERRRLEAALVAEGEGKGEGNGGKSCTLELHPRLQRCSGLEVAEDVCCALALGRSCRPHTGRRAS